MDRYKLMVLACIMVAGLTGCGQSDTATSSSPEPSIDTGIIDKVEPIADIEPTPAATSEIELPPVSVTYAEENDTNKDGGISKEEWQLWVDAHPEDTNQDMIISTDEQAPEAPVESKPVESKPVESTKPTSPAPVTPAPATPATKPVSPTPAPQTPAPTPPATEDDNYNPMLDEQTQAEKEFNEQLERKQQEAEDWLREHGIEITDNKPDENGQL